MLQSGHLSPSLPVTGSGGEARTFRVPDLLSAESQFVTGVPASSPSEERSSPEYFSGGC